MKRLLFVALVVALAFGAALIERQPTYRTKDLVKRRAQEIAGAFSDPIEEDIQLLLDEQDAWGNDLVVSLRMKADSLLSVGVASPGPDGVLLNRDDIAWVVDRRVGPRSGYGVDFIAAPSPDVDKLSREEARDVVAGTTDAS